MKLLVLAQTPPPLHGQSVMVQSLVNGLRGPGLELHHVNLRLSQDTRDIGRWRTGKVLGTLSAAFRALQARFRHGCDALYYVPAPPGKRGALYRDWVVMLLCRPLFRHCILHWHAVGLGEWLLVHATVLERIVTRLLLGRAHLSVVLGPGLQSDAEALNPRRVVVIPNGIAGPAPPTLATRSPEPFRLLFLGMCGEEKGLFAAASAVLEANRLQRSPDQRPAFTLTAAGPFDDAVSTHRFSRLCGEHPAVFRHAGTVAGPAKVALFTGSHALVLPTRYAAEGMPLVVLEALAHDRPVIATQWRAMRDVVTPEVGILVPPASETALVAAMVRLRDQPPPPGTCRARFLAHFTLELHLARMASALRALEYRGSEST